MSEITSTVEVVMPRLGLTMVEARITSWLKAEGAWVEKGEPLFELEHEKATLEIESPASGRLHILAAVDEVVPVLRPIAELETNLEEMHQAIEPPVVRATPKARALARKHGLSLKHLEGSGTRGMIVSADIFQGIPAKGEANASPVAQKAAQEAGVDITAVSGSGPHGRVMLRDIENFKDRSGQSRSAQGVAGLTGLRNVIANRLSASWVERPQVTLTTDADASALVRLRQQIEAEWGMKISYDAIFVRLASVALQEHPDINVRLTPAGLEVLSEINIGIAVDTERGLMVPVVHQANHKSLFEIDRELQALTQKAIEGTSLPDELSGGTFTITNLGAFEIDAFTPIINPPECAILGVGRIVSRPVGVDSQIVLREMLALSLSFDHRLVDGAPAARFLQRIKTLVERCALIGFEGGEAWKSKTR
jgi:pyruvate dehydrogenase E2 component (dihydrolipoamide acetyltransferase)